MVCHKWIIVNTGEIHKVFTSDSDSWKMSSGIVRYEIDGDTISFTNHSGSVYRCQIDNEGLTFYGQEVYDYLCEKLSKYNLGKLEYTTFEDYEKLDKDID